MNKQTLAFKQVGEITLDCDLYQPKKLSNGKVIMWLHGGGLMAGSKNHIPSYQLQTYLDAGFSVAAFDYRLAPETKLTEILKDVSDAYEWLNQKFQNIAVVGHSAGGYLSLYLSTKYSSINAVVSFYGYGSLIDTWTHTPSAHYLAQDSISHEEAIATVGNKELGDADRQFQRFKFYAHTRQTGGWAEAVTGKAPNESALEFVQCSPIFSLKSSMPTTLLFHAKDDWDVPYEQSHAFYLKSKALGNDCQLESLEEGGHMFDMPFDGKPSDRAVSSIEQTVAFLKQQF